MPNKRSALCVLLPFLFPTRNFHQPNQTRLKSPSSSMQLHLSPPSDLNLNRHVSVPPPLKINRPNSQKKKEANLGHTDFWYFNSNCDLREVKHQKTLKKSSLSLSGFCGGCGCVCDFHLSWRPQSSWFSQSF